MKKQYIAPEAQTFKIETVGMLALSAGFTDTTITAPENFGAPEFHFTEESFDIAEEKFVIPEENDFNY